MTVRYYPAIIERGSSGFGVFFPDLPGCTSFGETVQVAARNAEEALQSHIELSAEHGDTVPVPSDLDAIQVDADIEEVARALVRVEMPGRAVRVNITLPEDLLAAVDRHEGARLLTVWVTGASSTREASDSLAVYPDVSLSATPPEGTRPATTLLNV